MWQFWLVVAAVNAFIAVAAGAFGAHALKNVLSVEMRDIYEVAARYQMYHTVGLVIVAGLLARQPSLPAAAAGWCFLAGVLLFSGSLYALSLSGIRGLGAITPFGGLSFLAGWALVVLAAVKA